MMLKRIFTIAAVSLFLHISAQGQEVGLYFMPHLWQSNQLNPSFIPEQKIIYGLPSIYLNAHHSAAAYNDLIRNNSEGSTVLDLDPVIARMPETNIALFEGSLQTFQMAFGSKIWRASISHAVRTQGMMVYPKDLAVLAWQGNAAFIGETAEVGPNFQSMTYSELGLGFAMNIWKLKVGGRLKILSGMFDISTAENSASIHTQAESYALDIQTNYRINVASLLDYGSLTGDFDPQLDFAILSRNWGAALDLGATFDLNDKLSLSASVLDVGRIKWQTNARNYTSQGRYLYQGADLASVVRDQDYDFEATADTIEAIFDFQEGSGAYSTALAAKAYMGASYRINPILQVGGLLFAQQYRQKTLAGVAVNANARIGKIATAGLVYSVFNRTYDNIGLNTTVKVGPVQLYLATDNVMAVFKPFDSRHANIRLGMNMAMN